LVYLGGCIAGARGIGVQIDWIFSWNRQETCGNSGADENVVGSMKTLLSSFIQKTRKTLCSQ
jgi:hypothetical protein